MARFHAASNRSSASAGGPTRISRTLGKRASGSEHVLFEIVAQLLDRPEFVRQRAAAHAPAARRVLDKASVTQDVLEIVAQLDLEMWMHLLAQQQHMA